MVPARFLLSHVPHLNPSAPKKATWGTLTPAGHGRPDKPRPSRGQRAGKSLSVSEAEQEAPVYRTRLIIPGMTMLNMGNSFRNPHRTQPPFTWDKLFPARQPWTKICRGDTGGGGGAFSESVSLGCLCRARTAGACSSRGALGREGRADRPPRSPGAPRHAGPQETRVTGQHVLLGAAAQADGGGLPLASLLEPHAQHSGSALYQPPPARTRLPPRGHRAPVPATSIPAQACPSQQMGIQS